MGLSTTSVGGSSVGDCKGFWEGKRVCSQNGLCSAIFFFHFISRFSLLIQKGVCLIDSTINDSLNSTINVEKQRTENKEDEENEGSRS